MAATKTTRIVKTNARKACVKPDAINTNGRAVGTAVRKATLVTKEYTVKGAKVGGSWLSGFAAGLMGK